MTKADLFERLRAALQAELDVAKRLARETAAAANHPEARPENDKDTRKIELSYLAAGQAARAKELEGALGLLAAVPIRAFRPDEQASAGALVTLDVNGKTQRVLLAPAGGGSRLDDGRGEISVVTPQAPLGRGLLGKRIADSFEVVLGGKAVEVEIVGLE